jgi:hypothetical protein
MIYNVKATFDCVDWGMENQKNTTNIKFLSLPMILSLNKKFHKNANP